MNARSESPSPQTTLRRNNARHSRRWLPYTGAVLLAGLIVAGLWPKPVPVETAHATVGRLRAAVEEEGKTRIKHRFVVSAPVSGQLRRIALKPGAVVQVGETVLAVIDPALPALVDARARTLAGARRDAAAANLEKARAAHQFAVGELRRFQELHTEGSVSIRDLEVAQLREASSGKEEVAAHSVLREAEAELTAFNNSADAGAGGELAPVEVRAPTHGRVLRVFEEDARVVIAGTPLVEIGDPADLEIVIEVLSRDGAAIAPGTRVELEQWGGSVPLAARVRLVEPAAFTKISALGVEEQRVNVVADLVTPPDQRRNLGDHFRVEAKIVLWETNQALRVPSGALFRRGEQWATFAVADGRARLRPVHVGRSSGVETQILKGLKEGDEVILYPGDRVRDGQRIKPIRVEP